MALSYVNFKNKVELHLQDSGNTNFAAADLDDPISDACREAGGSVPHVIQVSFTIESRTGTASSTSSGNLVDATKSQFVAGDVGKDVYNTTDKTWARITTFTSTTTVALSKDIMAVNEKYEIYNAGCTQENQVNISDVGDNAEIDHVEYPVGTSRSWELIGNILTVKKTTISDSRVLTSGTQPDTEVIVWFKKRHLISQLTDLAADVNNVAGYSAGATSMAIDGLQATGTIEAGQEFTLANTRGTYTVTADATIAANAATISFFPALESAVANNVVITFTGSTLTPVLEPPVAELAAGLAARSKVMSLYKHAFDAVTAVALTTTAITAVAARITQAIADLASGRVEAAKISAILDTANTELDKIGARLTQATTDVAAGRTEADKVPAIVTTAATAIGLVAARIAQAVTDIASARTAIALGVTAIANAKTEMDLSNAQVDLAVTALSSGNSLINTIPVGGGAPEYMNQAASDVRTAQGFMLSGQGLLQASSGNFNNATANYGAAAREVDAGMARVREAQANLAQANTDMAANRTYIDQAVAQLRLAQGYFQEAQGYVLEANSRMANNASYLQLASGELNAGRVKIEEGNASITKAAMELRMSDNGRNIEAWGRNMIAEAKAKLSRLTPRKYRTSQVYTRA